MKNPRKYGRAPFDVAVIHGGPGAPGYMAPVARELSSDWGVLEPLQTTTSLEGQLQELHMALEESGDPPVALIGSSWGAMLGYIFAARYPTFVKKLILIGSAVYEEEYAGKIQETRLSRLDEGERREAHSLMESFGQLIPRAGHATVLGLDVVKNPKQVQAQIGVCFEETNLYEQMSADKLGIADEGNSRIVQLAGGLDSVIVKQYDSADALRRAVEAGAVDVGMALPAGFDDIIVQGQEAKLVVYVWGQSLARSRAIAGATIAYLVRAVAGQESPVDIVTTTLGNAESIPLAGYRFRCLGSCWTHAGSGGRGGPGCQAGQGVRVRMVKSLIWW